MWNHFRIKPDNGTTPYVTGPVDPKHCEDCRKYYEKLIKKQTDQE